MENNYLEIHAKGEVWREEFDPRERTHHEVIDAVQTFWDKEEHNKEITIHIHMAAVEDSAVVE